MRELKTRDVSLRTMIELRMAEEIAVVKCYGETAILVPVNHDEVADLVEMLQQWRGSHETDKKGR